MGIFIVKIEIMWQFNPNSRNNYGKIPENAMENHWKCDEF